MIKFKVIPKKPFGTWQFGKIGVLVNFIIQKLKSKHLVCVSLSDESLNLRRLRESLGPEQFLACDIVPGIFVNYFLSFPQKYQGKLRQTKCLLFNF